MRNFNNIERLSGSKSSENALGLDKPDHASGFQVLAVIALVMAVLFTTQSFNFLFAEPGQEGLAVSTSVRSSPVYGVFVLSMVALVGFLFVVHLLTRRLSARLWIGIGIIAYVIGSAFWSVDASATLVSGAILSFQIVAAYVLAVYLTPASFVRTLFYITVFIVLASFVALILVPELVNEPRPDGWIAESQFRGIVGTKNRVAMLFTATVMMSILIGPLRVPLFWRTLMVILALIGIALSSAATAVVALLLVTMLSLWMKYVRVLALEIAFAVAVVYLLLILLLPFIDFSQFDLFSLLGRDPGLTGRDQLWALAVHYFKQRPLLGYGYYGFFSPTPYSPVWSFWDNFRYFFTVKFHNSAADVAVHLGLVGIAIFASVCFGAFLVVFNRTIDVTSRCILIMLLHVSLVDSMTNFVIFYHNSSANLIVFYALFAAGVRYDDTFVGQRRSAQAGEAASRDAKVRNRLAPPARA